MDIPTALKHTNNKIKEAIFKLQVQTDKIEHMEIG